MRDKSKNAAVGPASFATLISPDELRPHMADEKWAIVDCRFNFDDIELGRQQYQKAHLPGAIYAHLDEDLTGQIVPGKTGRHPLPNIATLAKRFSSWGIDEKTQVVCYAEDNLALAQYRLWWLLRWLGHYAVAILDGGLKAWEARGYPTSSEVEQRQPGLFIPHPRLDRMVTTDELVSRLDDPDLRLFDARSLETYNGTAVSTYDPFLGHIQGAQSAPSAELFDADGKLLSQLALETRFEHLFAGSPSDQSIFYCGSGVRAIQSVFACVHIGLSEPRLYPGSWSEWITDPQRPVVTP